MKLLHEVQEYATAAWRHNHPLQISVCFQATPVGSRLVLEPADKLQELQCVTHWNKYTLLYTDLHAATLRATTLFTRPQCHFLYLCMHAHTFLGVAALLNRIAP